MLKYSEELVPMRTKCERFVKKFTIQRRADAVIPNCNSRTSRSMEWSTTILTYKQYFRHFHFPVRRTGAYRHKSPNYQHHRCLCLDLSGRITTPDRFSYHTCPES